MLDKLAGSLATAIAVTAAAGCFFAAGSSWAQTIEAYFADTSDYESPAFRVTDRYSILTPICYTTVAERPAINGASIRLAARLHPRFDCAHADQFFDVVVDERHYLYEPLPAGTYAVEFGYLLEGNWIPRASSALAVDDGKNKCSRMPEYNDVLVGTVSPAVSNRMAAVAANPALDPALHEALLRPVRGNPFAVDAVALWYYALDDTQHIARRIAGNAALGVTYAVADGFVCFATSPPAPRLEIVEFFNTQLGHYFITADPAEMAFIDHGGAGPGWQRSGETISGFAGDICSNGFFAYPTPLYRFYGTRGVGPNSHFFTADRSECGQVRRDPGWTYEAMPFRVWAPIAGRCPANSLPVFRLYNGRAAQNDSNHRYTAKSAIVDQMLRSGWKNEGVTICIPQR